MRIILTLLIYRQGTELRGWGVKGGENQNTKMYAPAFLYAHDMTKKRIRWESYKLETLFESKSPYDGKYYQVLINQKISTFTIFNVQHLLFIMILL